MIDILSVVYQAELEYLKIQARSIQQYTSIEEINNIIVVVNDHDNVCDQIDPTWYGSHASKLRIIPYSRISHLRNEIGTSAGWENQQLCKLVGASLSTAEWCLILDTKCWFINPLKVSELFYNGKSKSITVPIDQRFLSSKNNVEELFNIDLPAVVTVGVPSMLHTKTVVDLILTVAQLSGMPFDKYFLEHVKHPTRLTEFYLYSGFVLYQQSTYNNLYINHCDFCEIILAQDQEPFLYTDLNIADWDQPNFDTKLEEVYGPRMLTVSVHPRAYALMTNEQQDAWVNFLLERNLIADPKETKIKLNIV